jgi:hypothetical protein
LFYTDTALQPTYLREAHTLRRMELKKFVLKRVEVTGEWGYKK